jgi:hypothetical protein
MEVSFLKNPKLPGKIASDAGNGTAYNEAPTAG